MHVQSRKTIHFTISYGCNTSFDETKFFEDLQSVPWDTMKSIDDTYDVMKARLGFLRCRCSFVAPVVLKFSLAKV